MKEKYKDWAMTLRLRDCKDPNCAYCGAANLLDRLSALPDEAPPADDFMERFRLEGAWYKGVNDRKWIDARHAWYEAKYPLAQSRIAELEKQLSEAQNELQSRTIELLNLNNDHAILKESNEKLLKDAIPISVLKEHWLTSVECHHESETDVSTCYCCVWRSEHQPNVPAAVNAWIEHLQAINQSK